MKVLILTLTLGAGHNQVAKNIAEELKSQGKTVKIVNMFENETFKQWLFGSVGFSSMQVFPKISDYFYNKAYKNKNKLYNNVSKSIKEGVIEVINNFEPDIILSTHILGRLITKNFGKEINKPFLNYFIVTDYELPAGLEGFQQDEYIVIPGKDFKIELSEKGLDTRNILTYGIPVKDKFYKKISKEEALKELNINLDLSKKIILVTSGGKGFGNTVKIIKELSNFNDYQIISVAGKNKHLKSKIDKIALKKKNKIISFGFTDKMDVLMSVADFIVGKTGGITSTEAIAKGLPLISVGRTPKPENSNLLYLIGKNMAAQVKKPKNLNQIINDLNIDLMKKNYTEFSIKDSTKKITSHMIEVFEENKK
jgi:processive 1,2-diacylglycerol beta-glucosyltransferase